MDVYSDIEAIKSSQHINNEAIQSVSNSVTHIAAVLQQFQEDFSESRKNKTAKKSFNTMQESPCRCNTKEGNTANDFNSPSTSTVVSEATDSHTPDINSNHKINSTGKHKTISHNNTSAGHDDLCVISAEPEICLILDNPETTIPA
jgi:hypothetical protein